MPGFDPGRATQQTFVDCIVAAFHRSVDGGGAGYGWHLTGLHFHETHVDMTWETPTALRGWDPTQPNQHLEGPHIIHMSLTAEGNTP